MLLFKYFTEIKNRIILTVVCWVSVFIVSYYYKETLLFLLVKLSVKNSELIYFYFIATNLTDVFKTYLDISYFVSFQFYSVVVVYNIVNFFIPGLFVYEYKKIKYFIITSFCFILFGISLLNLKVLEYVFNFFLSFNANSYNNVDVFFEFKITEYTQFYKDIYLTVILLSQFFALIFIFIEQSKNMIEFISITRKFFYLIFLTMSTVFTPPEIIGQLVTTLSLIIYFEVLILFSVFRKRFT